MGWLDGLPLITLKSTTEKGVSDLIPKNVRSISQVFPLAGVPGFQHYRQHGFTTICSNMKPLISDQLPLANRCLHHQVSDPRLHRFSAFFLILFSACSSCGVPSHRLDAIPLPVPISPAFNTRHPQHLQRS
jgi:hypothetical protein